MTNISIEQLANVTGGQKKDHADPAKAHGQQKLDSSSKSFGSKGLQK
ncbi:MAG TPA: hypothetical protein VGG28_13990 [Kofleriaceae bacterium]|jgi:hypothetical protein